MQISLGERKEWISLMSANAPNTHRVITASGDEFEFVSNDDEPIDVQIVRLIANRSSAKAS